MMITLNGKLTQKFYLQLATPYSHVKNSINLPQKETNVCHPHHDQFQY